MIIKGKCHCGAIGFCVDDDPQWITECNCSLCGKIGALWVHSMSENVEIHSSDGATIRYIQGDKTLACHTCRVCGCTTHWESLARDTNKRMAVNVRLADPKLMAHLPVRHFDGAKSWTFLD